jgi:hypothetical protein
MVEDDDEEDIEGEESSVFDEELEEVEQEPELPSPEKQDVADPPTNSDIFGLKLQPKSTALRETNGNKSPIRSPRKVAFSASIPNTPTQVEDENADASGLDLVGAEKISRPTSASRIGSEERVSRSTPQEGRTLRHVSCDQKASRIVNSASNVRSSSPITPPSSYMHSSSNAHHQTRKRHSSPHAHPDEPSPKLTVHDKLAQAEADAVAIAQGLRVASTAITTDEAEVQQEQSVKKRAMRSPTKTKIQGRPKRRKSTLTPEELENLLGC